MKRIVNILIFILFANGLFAQKQTINIGTSANDGTGDPLRTAFTKINENFTEVYDSIPYMREVIGDTATAVRALLRSENTWPSDSLNYASKSMVNDSIERLHNSTVLAQSIIESDTAYWGSKQNIINNNIIYVPIDGNIQTYVDNASSGSTLILASGVYTITSYITIDKELNIVGQGSSGFVTSPVTPSHGTLITSSTASIVGFQIENDNIRISDLSINLTGASSTAINTDNNLKGLVFYNIDVIVNCSGWAAGFTVLGSDVIMRNLTFYVSSSDFGATGVWFYNNSSTTQNSVADCFNVTGTVDGTSVNAYCFLCDNNNSSYTVTLNLQNSLCRAIDGTDYGIGVGCTSTTTNNAIVNAYLCTFEGDEYDAYQTGTNQLNLGGSVMVNDRIFGTVTYRAAMVSQNIRTDTVKTTGNVFSKNYYNGNAIVEDSMLMPKKYIDDIGIDNIYANNGINRDVDTFKLGGTLNESTYFTQTGSNEIGITSTDGDYNSYYEFDAYNAYFEVNDAGNSTSSSFYLDRNSTGWTCDGSSSQTNIESDGADITVSFIGTGTLQYAGDYSANYTSRSHVDSAFVGKAIKNTFPYSQELTDNISWTSTTGKYFYLNSGSATNYSEIFSSPSETYLLDFEEATSGDYEGQLHISKGVVDFYARASDTLRSAQLDSTGFKINSGHSTTMANVGGILKDFHVDAANVTTGETDLYSYPVPADVLASNDDKLIAEFSGENIVTTTNEIKAYFAGTNIFTQSNAVIAATGDWRVQVTIIRVSSSVARTTVQLFASGDDGSSDFDIKTVELTSKDWTISNILKITGQAANSNEITAKMGYIEYKPAGVN
jgi:hypothetical protein